MPKREAGSRGKEIPCRHPYCPLEEFHARFAITSRKIYRNLDQAACPVESFGSSHGAPVGEITEYGEAWLDDECDFLALIWATKPTPQGRHVRLRVVQTLGFWAMSRITVSLGEWFVAAK